MRIIIIRWIGLIAGSVLSVFMAGAILFAGAYFIEGISDGIQEPIIETIVEFLGLLCAVLIIVGVVIAWFNSRLGGFLITILAMIQIIAFYEPEISWMQISMLLVGLILLFYVYYNKTFLKK